MFSRLKQTKVPRRNGAERLLREAITQKVERQWQEDKCHSDEIPNESPYAIQERGVLNQRFLKADIREGAVRETATRDAQLVEACTAKCAIRSFIRGSESSDGPPDEVSPRLSFGHCDSNSGVSAARLRRVLILLFAALSTL